jgi:predicted transcriptional regulator
MAVPGTGRTLSMLLEPELLQQMQEAAAVYGASMAAWLREAVRRVTRDDLPDSWRTGVIGGRSHDSQTYGKRFRLRLDETTTQKLQEFVEQFGRSRAEIIRQLVAQATPEAFPTSWRLAAAEHRQKGDG